MSVARIERQRKEQVMRKIVSLIALFSVGSLLFLFVRGAHTDTDESHPASPPAAATDPSASHTQGTREPADISHEATDSDSSDPSAEPHSDKLVQESIPLAASKPAQQQTLVSSSAFVGTTVKDLQGEKLGELRELMIDPQSGRIVYGVMATGGVLGMGEKPLAIPWETFKVGLEKDELIVEIDKDKLQAVPNYEMSQR
jgi:sporulation protein YlmC with PRC-barrel domain